MAFPIFRFTEESLKHKCSEELLDDLFVSTLAFDPLVFITSLVLGILGLTSVIGMPAAAAYALVGVSTGIALIYIGALLKTCYFDKASNPSHS